MEQKLGARRATRVEESGSLLRRSDHLVRRIQSFQRLKYAKIDGYVGSWDDEKDAMGMPLATEYDGFISRS